MDEVIYSIYPDYKTIGGQQVSVPCGVKGEHPSGIVAICTSERSQHRNKKIVSDMIEYALASRM